MKKITLLYTLCLAFAVAVNADNRPDLSVLFIDSALVENANAVIRKSEVILDVEDAESATKHVKFAVTRLNSKAGYSAFRVPYDMYSKVKNINIALYDANGKLLRRLKKDDISDHASFDGVSIYSDDRYKYADVVHSQYPYTIEYEYTLSSKGLFNYDEKKIIPWFSVSVEDWKYSLKIPTKLKMLHKAYGYDFEPEQYVVDDQNVTTFSCKNLKALKYEPFAPNDARVFPLIRFIIDQINVEKYRGNMEDWESFSRFMYYLNEGHDNLSDEMIETINQLIANAENDKEKIDILYKYIQENMRYVSVQLGIGGWKAYDAAYVEKNKYGDCKALTWFMKSMLDEIGIESYPALVAAGEENVAFRHDPNFSYPAFNHVFLTVPSEDLWLECTSKTSPTGYAGSFTDDRTVLLIQKDGGQLIQTPVITAADNVISHQAQIQLTEEGGASITNAVLSKGPQHEDFRSLVHYYSQKEQEEWFLEDNSLPTCTIEKLNIQAEDKYPKALMEYEVNIRKYGSKGGKRMFIPINCVNPFDGVPPANANRQFPISVGRAWSEKDQITIQLPANYQIESIPDDNIALESPYGTYKMTIQKDEINHQLIYNRELVVNKVDSPATSYEEFRGFLKSVAKADKMKIVLVQKKT